MILLELQKEDRRTDKPLKGFLLELYAYLALVGNITINSHQRTICLDPFLFSLDSLKEYETFGCMFGCASKLFEIIPSICLLGRNRVLVSKQEQADPTFEQYQALQTTIKNWRPPQDMEAGTEYHRQLVIAAQIYQQGLLIFLHASFFTSQIDDPGVYSARLPELEIEHHTDKMFELIDTISEEAASTILWPMIIMGSCLRSPTKQKKLREMWATSLFRMTSLSRVIQLLDWLWDDPTAFGPHGLEIVMRKHKVNFCMA